MTLASARARRVEGRSGPAPRGSCSDGSASGGLPPRSPNLNAYAERFVRTIKEDCLNRLILVGERALRRAVDEFVTHYHHERNHQGRHNAILFPAAPIRRHDGPIACRPRLGGLLKYYHRPAA